MREQSSDLKGFLNRESVIPSGEDEEEEEEEEKENATDGFEFVKKDQNNSTKMLVKNRRE